MENLAAYFSVQGGDTKKVFSELNGEERKYYMPDATTIRKDVMSDGAELTCIQDGKVVADLNPQNIGKDAGYMKNDNDQPLLKDLIEKMRTSHKKENVITYGNLSTNIPSPSDNSKTLSKKYVVVAYGRKALLGDKLNKQHHNKFICYVAYPVK